MNVIITHLLNLSHCLIMTNFPFTVDLVNVNAVNDDETIQLLPNKTLIVNTNEIVFHDDDIVLLN